MCAMRGWGRVLLPEVREGESRRVFDVRLVCSEEGASHPQPHLYEHIHLHLRLPSPHSIIIQILFVSLCRPHLDFGLFALGSQPWPLDLLTPSASAS
jgi:hypothetical protein